MPDDEDLWKFIKAAIVGIIVIALIAWFSPIITIGPGERGTLMEFNRVTGTVLDPGIHFIIPVMNSVARVDVQTQVYEVDASAASKDLQDAKTRIAVNYHIIPETSNILYRDVGVGYRERLIAPAIQEVTKASTAEFSAEELITKRPIVKDAIQVALENRLLPRGIAVESVSITNFEFGTEFTAAIEQKVTAQQRALTAENDLKRIQIEANQTVAKAKGDADSIVLMANAKAEEIKIIQEQLKVSPQYVNYLAVRQCNGVLPYVTGGSVPLVPIPIPVAK